MIGLNCNSFLPRVIFKVKGKVEIPGNDKNAITLYFKNNKNRQWKRWFLLYPSIHIERLFFTLKPSDIIALIKKATQIDADYNAPELLSYFCIFCEDEKTAQTALDELLKIDQVETAYLPGGLSNPSTLASGKLGTNGRGYLNAAPEGIDAKYAWNFEGGKGEGHVKFIDIEQGWSLDHEALHAATLPHTGINLNSFQDHGAATLGVIMMKENDIAGEGITPYVTGFVISQWRPDGSPNDADAVLTAVYNLTAGDVLLLEMQSFGSGKGNKIWPVEIQDAVFEVIKLATILGIVVIEAAANGSLDSSNGNDLDTFYAGNKDIMNPESKDFRDSGAIIVAAATAGLPHRKMQTSNYGKRVNCYAWGENVLSAGYYPNTFTPYFNGTSSASAIIAGAAIAIQSIAEAKHKTRLKPCQLRSILSNEAFGTPSAGKKELDKIGVMPDLKKIIDKILNHHPITDFCD